MNISSMRKWHRSLGIILALFIIIQTSSGLVLTIAGFSQESVHSSAEHVHGEHHNQSSAWHSALGWMHYSQSSWMGIYRTLLGIGILVQTVLGVMIFFKTRHNMSSRRS